MTTVTISLQSCHNHPLSHIGGKARALGRLMSFGAPVPPGFVVPPEIPLDDWVMQTFDSLGAKFVAVRSSATGEDGQGQSWAGQFESFLNVTRTDLLERIEDCRRSGHSARAQAYDKTSRSMPVAVVVQAMIAADVAGVMFTANPITKNRDEILVEAVYGLGEQLVQGLVTPDNFIICKSTGQIKSSVIATKTTKLVGSAGKLKLISVPILLQMEPSLSVPECRELAKLAVQLEEVFGLPLDIEFAYAADRLYVVQARPITTL